LDASDSSGASDSEAELREGAAQKEAESSPVAQPAGVADFEAPAEDPLAGATSSKGVPAQEGGPEPIAEPAGVADFEAPAEAPVAGGASVQGGAPELEGLLDKERTEEGAPEQKCVSEEDDAECREFWAKLGSVPSGTAFQRKLARFSSALAKIFGDKLEAHGFSSRPDEAAVDGALEEAIGEMLGPSLESRLEAAEDDVRRLTDMPQESLSQLRMGVVVRSQMLAKILVGTAHEQTVGNKKKSKRAAVFKDKIDGMEAAAKRVKTELAAVVGGEGLELGWFDSSRNLQHMFLEDVEAFKGFWEETVREFEADPDLEGVNVKEKFVKVLRDVDCFKDMDAVFTTEFGKDYDFARADHLVYKALLKKEWLRLLKQA